MANGPVEKKVTAATLAATAVGVAVAVLNAVVGDSDLLGSLPPAWQSVAVVLVPPLVTFAAAWQARHTPRGQ